MRSIWAFLFGLTIFSCNSQNSVLTKEEFVKIYLDSLRKRNPEIRFKLNPDLSISSSKNDLELKHYADNAYSEYQLEPDSIIEVISRYVTSSSDMYVDRKTINVMNIVPVIKPIDYLDEIAKLSKDGKVSHIVEKYNDQLIIMYAEDSKNNIRFLIDDQFKTLSIPRDSLKSIALANFDKIMSNIKKQGGDGVFMVIAGGNYEASLILLPSLWTKENFPVDGGFVIAIPNRDLLFVTGSKDKKGISRIKRDNR